MFAEFSLTNRMKHAIDAERFLQLPVIDFGLGWLRLGW